MRESLKPTVLVVEDEAIVRMDLTMELEDRGFAVLEASRAGAAMALFRTCPDLHAAVVDIGLRDGRAATTWSRPCAASGRAAPSSSPRAGT
jgi:DNA-binding response OmpR family regulator